MPATNGSRLLPEVIIRPATPDDAAKIAAINLAAWQAGYAHLLPAEVLNELSVERRTERWRTVLVQGASDTIVADEGGEILGFASFGRSRDHDVDDAVTAELRSLYVAPEHWSRGVGRRLWAATRQLLVAREYQIVVLWVFEGNDRARSFYEKAGFLLDVGRKRIFNMRGNPIPAVRYRLPLA